MWGRHQFRSRANGYSLRRRLTAATVGGGIVAGLISIAIVLAIAWNEVNEAYDDTLKEGARLVLALGEGVLPAGGTGARVRPRDERSEILQLDYQIISKKGTLLARGEDAPRQPFVDPQSRDKRFYDVEINGKPWRVYVRHHKSRDFLVQIGQKWKDRNELVFDVLESLAWPLVGLWLLLGLVNGWLVRRLTAPLARVARRIESKSPTDLSPLPDDSPAQEIRAMAAALNHLLARLAQALDAERRFTADAAHELRTPLAALGSRIQLMQRSHAATAAPALLADLQQLREDVARSTALTENLLQLARLDPQCAHGLVMDVIDLPALLDDVVKVCAPSAQARSIAVTVDCQVATLCGCRDALFSALRNLLDNAIRYGRSGGRAQVVAVGCDDGKVAISVCDDGPGVSDADRARLVQRFFRVLGTRTTGSGLGLSITQRIAELHGGTLRIGAGLDGHGLGVTLVLPGRIDNGAAWSATQL